MSPKVKRLLLIGSAFWVVGIVLIIRGYGEYAWLPISWGGLALGYCAALAAGPEKEKRMTLPQRAVEAAKKVLEDEFAGTSGLKDLAERMLTAALAVDGVVLIPKEPTASMMAAGGKKAEDIFFRGEGSKATTLDAMKDVWTAMIAAASDAEESPGQEKI